MVEVAGSNLSNITFEDLADALDKDSDFRAAVLKHLGQFPTATARASGNQVNIETKANFALDESKIFDLNGEGLKVTVVAVN